VLRIALTGGIASGKSTVAERLAERGAVIIDADLLAREVVEPGTPALAAIVERFGLGVLDGPGLNRARLGALVFADPAARRELERIVHPAVRARAAELEQQLSARFVVHVIPLLVETGQQDRFDICVVVDIDPEIQLSRLMARSGLAEQDARSRVAAQVDRETRRGAADFVLDNSGEPADLERQVETLWAKLLAADAAHQGLHRHGDVDTPEPVLAGADSPEETVRRPT